MARWWRRSRAQTVFLFINPVVRALLRSPLHRLLSGRLMLLTFTGRKSGRRYTTPVSYMRFGEIILSSTRSAWARNLQGGVPVALLLRGEQHTGRADLITDEEGMTAAYGRMLEAVPGYARAINVSLDADRRPNREQVARSRAAGYVVVRVLLD